MPLQRSRRRPTAPASRLLLASVITWSLASATVHAQTIGSRENFNRIYKSAHFLGRGDTGIAIADHEDAIFYNPAGLALGKGIYKSTVLVSPRIEFSKNARDLGRRIAAEDADAFDAIKDSIGKPNHVGVSNFTGLVLRRAAVGAVATSNVDILAHKSPEAGGLEVIDASADQTLGATFSLAEAFLKDSLLIGITAKYLARGRGEISVSADEADTLNERLADRGNFMGSGEGAGADLGLMWRLASARMPMSLGLTIADIGNTKITPSEPTQVDLDVKQTINAGFAIEPTTKLSKIRLLVDVRDIAGNLLTNERKKLHLGGELTVLELVGITGGLSQGYPTFGLFLDTYIFRFDAGAYTEEIGDRVGTRPDTRYYVRLRAGF